MGLIVDTGVFIKAERDNATDPLMGFPSGQDLGISTITASELLEGLHRADSEVRYKRRDAFINGIFASLEVIPFTLDIAYLHAKLKAELRRRGRVIGAHDLIIAATALYRGWGVVTMNIAEFQRVPDLLIVAR